MKSKKETAVACFLNSSVLAAMDCIDKGKLGGIMRDGRLSD